MRLLSWIYSILIVFLFAHIHISYAKTIDLSDYLARTTPFEIVNERMQKFWRYDTISADLVVEKLKHAGTLDTLKCENLWIDGKIDLKESGIDTVQCTIEFSSSFVGDAYFNNITFAKGAYFEGSTFEKMACFKSTEFYKKASFWQVRFRNGADFTYTTFRKGVSFVLCRFYDNRELEDPFIYKYRQANWPSNLIFRLFNGGADFSFAEFYEMADFSYIHFFANAFFWSSIFFDKSRFIHTNFHSKVDLSECEFEKDVDFRAVRLSDTSQVILDNLKFRHLFIYWKSWAGKIDTNDSSRVDGLRKNHIMIESELRNQGLFGDMDNCYIERRKIENEHKPWWIQDIEWLLIWQTCGYGVKPLYTLRFGGIIILLFSLAYFKLGSIQERKWDQKKERPPERKIWQRLLDALYFSVNTFTTVGYGDWYPTAEKLSFRIPWLGIAFRKKPIIKYVRKELVVPLSFRALAMIEGLLGWLLLALFLVTLGRIWIR